MTAGNYRHCGTRWMDDISGNENGLYLLMKSESYVEDNQMEEQVYTRWEKEGMIVIDPACTYGIDWPL